ncbi:MAG: LPS export ABC transporter periplasmic protein LptC [Polaribacter sp.]|nr:LPS export ABC transporter periplasmic protein LptC [Polaribacter sp.]
MNRLKDFLQKSIAVTFCSVMLFSCNNNTQKVRDFLADKNLPLGIARDANHVYKDSGRITSKLITPMMLDFSNRDEHPYNEFPNGIKIINFEKNTIDSVTITGNYAITYSKTSISEIRGKVLVVNHTDKSILKTEQLFWDEKTKYFVSEKAFMLIKENDTIYGIGFESKDDLSGHLAKKTTGRLESTEE